MKKTIENNTAKCVLDGPIRAHCRLARFVSSTAQYSLIRLYRVAGIASVTALMGLSIPGAIVQAQELTLPTDATIDSSAIQLDKTRRVSSALADLQNRFTRLPITQQDSSVEGLNAGSVTIEAIASESAGALLSDLQNIGLEGGAAFGNLVSGRLPLSAVSAAEFLPTLQFISLSQPFTRAGIATNQGDTAMQTDLGRMTFGVDGAGITIGILSDSYNQLGGEAADIASGDLPTGVVVLDDTAAAPIIDEGRAMAQLIHDIAPGATLVFHTAFNGLPSFAQGILDLAAAGADVIVDDVGDLRQPMFQDGVVAQAVDQVVASGVVYFSAAGNSGSSSYEAPFLDSGLTLTLNGVPLWLHAFDAANPTTAGSVVQEITLGPGQLLRFTVQWDQPFASAGGSGSLSDLDVLLIDSTGSVVAGSVDSNIGADAVEAFGYQNNTGATQTVGLLIGVADGPLPGKIKWINLGSDDVLVENATNSSTSFGHPNAAGAVGVGASPYVLTPPFGVNPPFIEPFSSHGGLEILFDTAGNFLPMPEDRNKPDLTAPDGVDTTFFSSGDFDGTGFPNFFGTSAAAPNAAALAALQLSCNSGLTPTDIRAQQTGTAIDMETSGFDNISGAGLVDGLAAMTLACSGPPVVAFCNGEEVTVDLNTGVGIPGSGIDVILGTPGADVINALGGDDTICGEGGNDIINAGGGNDWVDAGTGADDIFGGGGNDELYGGSGDDIIVGGAGNDDIEGNAGDDMLFGQSGEDTIDGGSGVDDINGGAGRDLLFTGAGATVGTGFSVNGGGAADIIHGGADADFIRGGGGADTIRGGDGNDVITGGVGRDEIYGEAGADDIRGQDSVDTLDGGSGADVISGGAQDDVINGGSGDDMITGGSGDDVINGDAGSDTLLGGSDDDELSGGPSSGDTCDGQSGTDTASGSCETVIGVP